MRNTTTRLGLLLMAAALVLSPVAAKKKGDAPPEGLRLMPHLPQDPVLAWVMTIKDTAESFDEMMGLIGRFADEGESAEISGTLAEADAKLGFSLRDDLLANLGPEFAVTIDLPPIDQIAGSFAAPEQGIATLLGRLGILLTVRDRETIDGCLRKLVELAGGRVSEADDLFRVDLGPEEPEGATESLPLPPLFYGYSGNVLALGASESFLREALDAESGSRLGQGEDFKRVFAHLDAQPRTLTYVNLPKMAEMVQSSGMLQTLIQADENASQAMALFLSPEFVGVGLGATSVEVDGGVRTTTFGPSALGGGSLTPGIIAAIAIPNLLNAIDRGKQKRTMADMRSIGTAVESYSIDNNAYPVATDMDTLKGIVEPVYIRSLPTVDGWGNPFLYWSDGASYRIVSRGKDGAEDQDWSEANPDSAVGTQSFNNDIVFVDGLFVVYPEGQQQ